MWPPRGLTYFHGRLVRRTKVATVISMGHLDGTFTSYDLLMAIGPVTWMGCEAECIAGSLEKKGIMSFLGICLLSACLTVFDGELTSILLEIFCLISGNVIEVFITSLSAARKGVRGDESGKAENRSRLPRTRFI